MVLRSFGGVGRDRDGSRLSVGCIQVAVERWVKAVPAWTHSLLLLRPDRDLSCPPVPDPRLQPPAVLRAHGPALVADDGCRSPLGAGDADRSGSARVIAVLPRPRAAADPAQPCYSPPLQPRT